MAGYLESRSTKRAVLYYLDFKKKIIIFYTRLTRALVQSGERFWNLFFAKPVLRQDLREETVYVYDKEESPLVKFLKMRKMRKKQLLEARRKERNEHVDVRLISKTLEQGSLQKHVKPISAKKTTVRPILQNPASTRFDDD